MISKEIRIIFQFFPQTESLGINLISVINFRENFPKLAPVCNITLSFHRALCYSTRHNLICWVKPRQLKMGIMCYSTRSHLNFCVKPSLQLQLKIGIMCYSTMICPAQVVFSFQQQLKRHIMCYSILICPAPVAFHFQQKLKVHHHGSTPLLASFHQKLKVPHHGNIPFLLIVIKFENLFGTSLSRSKGTCPAMEKANGLKIMVIFPTFHQSGMVCDMSGNISTPDG